MKHLFTLFLMTITSSLTAQLKLPIVLRADMRITRQYMVDTTKGMNSLPDTVVFYPYIPIVLDLNHITIGLESHPVKSLKWPLDSQLQKHIKAGDPTLMSITCKDGVVITIWDKYITIMYPAVKGWWKISEIRIAR